jgi:AcrR family transcriptional regulator
VNSHSVSASVAELRPRKSPVQARSLATLDAIYEATIQVLVAEGMGRFTTTRVADRAGVSVGSLYQYYPNKRSLLAAVLERHLGHVSDVIEQVCVSQHGKRLADMARAVATAFVDVKMERPDVSKALYAVAEEHGGAAFVGRATLRGLKAISAMLASACDARPIDLELVSSTFLSAMIGPVRNLLETDVSRARIAKFREHVVLLTSAYLDVALRAR